MGSESRNIPHFLKMWMKFINSYGTIFLLPRATKLNEKIEISTTEILIVINKLPFEYRTKGGKQRERNEDDGMWY